MPAAKRLHRSDDEVVAGVCAGIAEYLDIDPIAARIAAVLLTVSTAGAALAVYVVMWLVLPKKFDAPAPIACAAYVPGDAAFGRSAGFAAPGVAKRKRGSAPVPPAGFVVEEGACRPDAPASQPVPSGDSSSCERGGMAGWPRLCVWVGSIVLAADAALLFDFFIGGVGWWQLWPMAVVVAGVVLMFVPARRGSHARRFSVGLVLIAAGGVALFMSIGILSPLSAPYAVSKLWPIFLVMAGLLTMNVSLRDEMFDFGLALCAIVLCVATCTAFALPGPVEYVTVDLPFGLRTYDINPWL